MLDHEKYFNYMLLSFKVLLLINPVPFFIARLIFVLFQKTMYVHRNVASVCLSMNYSKHSGIYWVPYNDFALNSYATPR